MGTFRLLPAGFPRGLVWMRMRIAHLLAGAPVLFIGIVLGVALTFRLAIGAVRPAPADGEPATISSSSPTSATRATDTPLPNSPEANGQPLLENPAGVATAAPNAPKLAPRRKPRSHGRR